MVVKAWLLCMAVWLCVCVIPGSKVDFIRFVQGVRSFREGMEAPMIVHCRYIQLVMNKIISEL